MYECCTYLNHEKRTAEHYFLGTTKENNSRPKERGSLEAHERKVRAFQGNKTSNMITTRQRRKSANTAVEIEPRVSRVHTYDVALRLEISAHS